MNSNLSDNLLSKLSEFVASKMGLHFPKERWRDLERGIGSVAREFGFDNAEIYVEQLLSSPLTRNQIEILASHLTVGETYFFRENTLFEIAQLATERGLTPSPEDKKKILKARAKALAREEEEKKGAEERVEVIEFLLANERYGIEANYIREVYPLKDLTPLPCTPPFVLGIISLRGQILSVIDIKKFFDLPDKGLGDLNKVIILHSDKPALSKAGGMEFAILADSVLGVRSIGPEEIQPSLPTLTDIRVKYLKGVAKDRMVILDGGKLLSDKKIVVHEEV